MQIRARGIHSFGYHDPNPLVFTPRRGIDSKSIQMKMHCSGYSPWGNIKEQTAAISDVSQSYNIFIIYQHIDQVPLITADYA